MSSLFKKIVVVGPQHPDTLPKCILVTLKGMGYDAVSVDERAIMGGSFAKGIAKKGNVKRSTLIKLRAKEALMQINPVYEKKVFTKVEKEIIAHKPDLVITSNGQIPPTTIKNIKSQTGARIVLWFPDHPANVGRQYFFGAPYDVLFFKDKYLVQMARRINLNAHYLPECHMPEWHKKVELTEEEKEKYECDITTAGNAYYYRAKIFEPLIEKYNVNPAPLSGNGERDRDKPHTTLRTKWCGVKFWGPPLSKWLDSTIRNVHQGESVMELEKSKAFNGAKIVVNTFQGEVEGVNLRTFEAAGCGAFQICEYRTALEELFEIGKEIVIFKNRDDLLEKVEYYLTHPEERKRIANAGHERANRDHTYKERIEKMLQIIHDRD